MLNGVKSLSFGSDAAAVVVFARTGPSARTEKPRGKDISAFLVALDQPGVTGRPTPTWAPRPWGAAPRTSRDVRVPADNLLGEEGQASPR